MRARRRRQSKLRYGPGKTCAFRKSPVGDIVHRTVALCSGRMISSFQIERTRVSHAAAAGFVGLTHVAVALPALQPHVVPRPSMRNPLWSVASRSSDPGIPRTTASRWLRNSAMPLTRRISATNSSTLRKCRHDFRVGGEKHFGVDRAKRDQRRGHVPVAQHHPNLACRSPEASTENSFERLRVELAQEPGPCVAQDRLSAELEQLEVQFGAFRDGVGIFSDLSSF